MNLQAAPGGCARIDGIERLVKFKAPFDGRLTVALGQFTGDWDLAVEHEGRLTYAESTSPDQTNPESFDVEIRRGQTVNMIGCNYSGGPEAELSYDFIHARLGKPEEPKLRLMGEETHEYFGACLYSPYSQAAACRAPWGEARLSPTGDYVRVEAEETTNAAVPLVLVEDRYNQDPTRLRLTFFCSKTKKPIELLEGADFVAVFVLAGPLHPWVCPEGPSVPAAGEITVTYFQSS